MQLGVLEQAEEAFAGLDEADGALAGLEGSMEADEGAETGAVHEAQVAGVDFDLAMFVTEGGVDGVLDRRGRGGGEFSETGHAENRSDGFGFHGHLRGERGEGWERDRVKRGVAGRVAAWESRAKPLPGRGTAGSGAKLRGACDWVGH